MPLTVSEQFYSIQGEGRWVGVPAVFLRLTGCNLTCSGWSYELHEGGGYERTENEDGTLNLNVWQDKITHLGCDSKHVWQHGDKMTDAEIIVKWEKEGWLERLQLGHGRCHLIITGGEPLLQQPSLIEFLLQLQVVLGCDQIGSPLFIEMETNGTKIPKVPLAETVRHYNISPKLSSAGDSEEKQVNPEAIMWYLDKDHERWPQLFSRCWKFVISTEDDLEEMYERYVDRFDIPRDEIWLMPEGGTRSRLMETAPMVAELAKRESLHYSPRLQVDIWNEVTGV